jgi:hypothetical protein
MQDCARTPGQGESRQPGSLEAGPFDVSVNRLDHCPRFLSPLFYPSLAAPKFMSRCIIGQHADAGHGDEGRQLQGQCTSDLEVVESKTAAIPTISAYSV